MGQFSVNPNGFDVLLALRRLSNWYIDNYGYDLHKMRLILSALLFIIAPLAFSKWKYKLQFKDIEIKNNSSGAPKFNIKGNSLKNLKKIFKKKKFKIHLSLSDDKPWAIASVIIFLYR